MKKDIKIPLVEKIQVLAAFEWDKDFLSKTSPKNSFSTGSICVVDGGQIR